MLGHRERTKEETHMQDAPYFPLVSVIFSYVANVRPLFYAIFCRTSVFWLGFHICFEDLEVTRPGFHLGAPKKVKLRQKHVSVKDIGKSSSRKLRRAIYYILYRMDPQKTHYKNSFSAKISKIIFSENVRLYFPPNSRSTAPLRPLSGSIGEL